MTHHHVPWKLHIRNRNDKIFKYLNQDIRGNCYKQSNNYCLKKTDLNKIDLKPTPITLYRCSDHPFPWMRTSWSCWKERMVDALALRADERRDKLRKASGRSKYPLIRRSLNGETYLSAPQVTYGEYIAIRREPGELKHLSSRRKRKKHRFRK